MIPGGSKLDSSVTSEILFFMLGAIRKVRLHSRGGGGQLSQKFCSQFAVVLRVYYMGKIL